MPPTSRVRNAGCGAAAASRDVGPHALAHLGAVDIALQTARTVLDVAAADIDADPLDRQDGGRLRALRAGHPGPRAARVQPPAADAGPSRGASQLMRG